MRPRSLLAMTGLLLLPWLGAGAQGLSSYARLVAVLPFRYDGVHILVRATIAPYPDTLNLLFDSGSEVNILEQNWAGRWKLKSDKASGVSGFSKGWTYLPEVRVDALLLGKARLENQSFFLQDIRDLIASRTHVDGIIGYQLLKNYTLKIDFDHHTLSLYTPGPYHYGSRGELLHIGMNFDTPILLASIPFAHGNILQGIYHITTGGDYGILFNYPYVQKYNLDKSLQMDRSVVYVEDMLRTVKYFNGMATVLTLGKFHVRGVAASYSPDIDDGNPKVEIAGALGNDIWKNFNMVLNLSRKELYLEPDRRFPR